MRRTIGWIAVLAMIGVLAACGDTSEGGTTVEAAVPPIAVELEAAPSATSTTGVAEASGSSEEAAVQPTAESLEQVNVDGLLWMREEEKLARDVYLTLADLWGLRPFTNIARSEQSHMDSVAFLLDRYDIAEFERSRGRGKLRAHRNVSRFCKNS